MKLILRALLFVSALGATGCDSLLGSECTTIGCSDALAIDVSNEAGRLPPGNYDVTVDFGPAPVTFTCTVAPDAATSRCIAPEDAPFALSVAPAVVGNTVAALLVRVNGTPAEVSVAVRIDGALAVERALTPSYTRFQPNGDCGPVCRSAATEVRF